MESNGSLNFLRNGEVQKCRPHACSMMKDANSYSVPPFGVNESRLLSNPTPGVPSTIKHPMREKTSQRHLLAPLPCHFLSPVVPSPRVFRCASSLNPTYRPGGCFAARREHRKRPRGKGNPRHARNVTHPGVKEEHRRWRSSG